MSRSNKLPLVFSGQLTAICSSMWSPGFWWRYAFKNNDCTCLHIMIHAIVLPWCCWSRSGTSWADQCPSPSQQLVADRTPVPCRRSHQWTWPHHHPQLWPETDSNLNINMHRYNCSYRNSKKPEPLDNWMMEPGRREETFTLTWACCSKSSLCLNGSFNSVYELQISFFITKSSKRSVRPFCDLCLLQSQGFIMNLSIEFFNSLFIWRWNKAILTILLRDSWFGGDHRWM